jgi:uncharacterized membrane-anchored protein
MLNKVPEVTVLFWVIKVLTTGMGEVASDFLAHQLDSMVAVGIGFVAFVAALVLQFRAKQYVAWVYWTAVVMVSVFGTMAADVLHVAMGVPYTVSTIGFALVLAAIFAAWHASEKTLSIRAINTPRRELFYWATVMATFALGTAAGDLTATTLGWGYFGSGVVFAVVIAVPAIAGRFGVNQIFAFWAAYVVTRPLGASFADWAGQPTSRTGLGWGLGQVALGLTVVIAALVGYLALTRSDIKADGDDVEATVVMTPVTR